MRLIDVEQFKHKINNSRLYGTKVWEQVLDMAFDCETVDAVPVVRCKDCRYCQIEYRGKYCITCGRGYLDVVCPNDYCSRGERKK